MTAKTEAPPPDRVYTARDSWRWAALALVFFAALLNYLDRQTIAFLKAPMSDEFGWSDGDYAHIVSAFQLATIVCTLLAGWFMDRVGLRAGYAFGVGGWSLAQIGHAVFTSVTSFYWVRAALGATEAINLPAAVKTVATWFRGGDRSLALGVMNAAPNIGAMLAPFIVAALFLTLGWRAAFVITGALGAVWLVAWMLMPRPPQAPGPQARTLRQELGAIFAMAGDRRAWAVALAKFFSDFVWVFLLFWTPDLFAKRYGLDMASGALPVAIVFTIAASGSLIGGWSASRLLASGVSYNLSRKLPMLAAACLAIPVPLIAFGGDMWLGVALVGLTLAAHQAFSTNVFGLCTDIFPARQVGLAIGFGGTFGGLLGLAMNEFTGAVLDATGSYAPMLAMCAVGKFVSLFILHVLVPSIDRTRAQMLAGEEEAAA
ncbi:MAG: MFS transporter [Hyphomonadaceae bacterium]